MYIPLVVDNAYTCDSRIKKFKEDEKERKLAEKKAKEDAARAAAEEKERVSINTLSEWCSRSQQANFLAGCSVKFNGYPITLSLLAKA